MGSAQSSHQTPSTDVNLSAAESKVKTNEVEGTTINSPEAKNPPTEPPKESKEDSSASHIQDWVPRCPHCDRANEYGQVMCDPSLPRVCQGGDDAGNDEKSSDTDTVWYEVISKVF